MIDLSKAERLLNDAAALVPKALKSPCVWGAEAALHMSSMAVEMSQLVAEIGRLQDLVDTHRFGDLGHEGDLVDTTERTKET